MRLMARVLVIVMLWATWSLRLHNTTILGTQADEGVHITVAEQVATGQATIYKDLFENRTPGGEWLLAGLFHLTGATIFATRVLSVGLASLTAAALYAIGRDLAPARSRAGPGGRLQGLVAGSLFALAPLAIFWGRFTMLEHFSTAAASVSMLLAILALRTYAGASSARRLWPAAGIIAGLAVTFKQTELVLVPVVAAFFLIWTIIVRFGQESRPRAETTSQHWKGALSWIAGCAFIVAILALLLLAQGALDDFLRFVSGAEQLAPLANWQEKLQVLWQWSVRQPVAPLAVLGALFVARRWQPGPWLVLLWGLAEAGAVLLPAQLDLSTGGFSHYLIPALAPASVLAGLGVVGLRRLIAPRLSARTAVGLLLLFAVLLTVPGWLVDGRLLYGNNEYPQPTTEAERTIGRATSLIAAPGEPIVVIGNAIFYHWAQRPPASQFFHWPGYLSSSSLAAPATADLTAALQSPQTAAVLLSRLHMRERLPASVDAALWENWTPAALFTYPYQDDVLLFLPQAEVTAASEGMATIGQAFTLQDIRSRALDDNTVLVRLVWHAEEPIDTDYTVFVHALDENGTLIAQNDGVPAVGFRPTSSWTPGQPVIDYHWLELPESTTIEQLQLSLGLYEASTGRRLPVTVPGSDGTDERDSYERPLIDQP